MEYRLTEIQLRSLLIEAGEVALKSFARHFYPATDALTERKARDYLRVMGEKPSLLEELVNAGAVKPKRSGKAGNSPKLYSLTELYAAVQSRLLNKTILNN